LGNEVMRVLMIWLTADSAMELEMGLAAAVAFAVVTDEHRVGADVGGELVELGGEREVPVGGLIEAVDVGAKDVEQLPGPVGIAVPASALLARLGEMTTRTASGRGIPSSRPLRWCTTGT
jgi:hypothetical protein